MQAAAGFIGEQHRRVREPAAHVVKEPAQHQVQAVQHRYPPRPWPRGAGALTEPDMQLAERTPAEVHVRAVQQSRLLRPQPSVI